MRIEIVDHLPLCATCVHFNDDNPEDETCAAFPGGIPDAILRSEADHREPFPGDRGIRFEEESE